MTVDVRKPTIVRWYRSHLNPQDLKFLHERSDLRGFAQTLGFLAIPATTGSLAFFSFGRLPWPAVVALVFLHGTVCAFPPNGISGLGQRPSLSHKGANRFFKRILAIFPRDQFRNVKAS